MNKNSPVSVSMVYMMMNNEVMNQVIAFYRDTNGMLVFVGAYPTNGRGTGIRKVSAATQTTVSIPLRHKEH